ncbi:MAG TPA: hypothetical protein PLU81_04965 [Deltaproteobacteria bacterium]|nr:hypothetical protein [Deltaproteobacteria bacterium]HPJ93520.1 hypothetical protein [Deltaproteobacteria bacterium]HPR51115.1 hypothetical protein [Deltaproteobacteria bacterium]
MERKELAKKIKQHLLDMGVSDVEVKKDSEENWYVLIHEHSLYPCLIMIDEKFIGNVFFDMMSPVNCVAEITMKLSSIPDFSFKIRESYHRSPYSGDLLWGDEAEDTFARDLPHYLKRKKEICGASYTGLMEATIGIKYQSVKHHSL